ncbi:D-alanyl-D-alanine carboxypeptidase family protein [Patescibacteria group bacterium]|nr:D-alanyl-D-alanine carboxypeptidase family protein [Patescibacteria group bacterium]
MKTPPIEKQFIAVTIALTVIALALAVSVWWLNGKINTIYSELASLSKETASSTAALQTNINEAHSTLSNAISAAEQNVGSLQGQLGNFQNQVGNISGAVTNLQKLSQLDPELLKKYSKVYFLNENYVPAHLSEIPLAIQYSDVKQMLIRTEVLPYLENMIATASSTGVALYVDSAYRSFDEQKALKSDYQMVYGSGAANSFSANQGYSEHQLGTAVDLITTGLGGQLDSSFDKTAAYQWLVQNAYKYGFTMSYPPDNGYYVYEPWHWRFVGVKLASDLHAEGKYFYQLDQQTLDGYLVTIFD